MKKDRITDLKYGICGGLVLFAIGMLRSILPVIQIGSDLYTLTICISFCGVLCIATYSLLKKHSSLLGVCVRSVAILVSYICFFILGAETGFVRSCFNLISSIQSPSADNLSGLLWITSFFTVVCVCIVVPFIKVLLLGINKLYITMTKKIS